MTGFPASVRDQILKLASINLCPNLSGQICCTLMMNPPQPGEPSHELYRKVRRCCTLVSFGARRTTRGTLHVTAPHPCDAHPPRRKSQKR